MIGRIRAWWQRRHEQVWIRLRLEEGPPVLLGPMDRFTADLFLVNRINPNPVWLGRAIVSAKIIPRA